MLATAELSTLVDVLVWRQFADCHAPDHHVGTPLVWALMMVLSRLALRERGSLRLHKICVAFFHAKLEQRVWVQPLWELGLHDRWSRRHCWRA